MSWYSPKPRQLPKRLPRRRPIKAIPSGIGDQGIVGNWLFYYLKGGNHLHDFSGEGNHGTINGASWKDGRYGWALEFDGVDDYVDCGDNTGEGEGAITLSAWVKADSITSVDGDGHGSGRVNTEVIIQKSGDGDDAFGYELGQSDQVAFYIDDGADHTLDSTDGAVSTDTWYHIVVVYDKNVTNKMKIYINGNLDNEANLGGSDIITTSNPLQIGGVSAWEASFDGIIAIARIYSVAKSASWIKRRFERTKGIFSV